MRGHFVEIHERRGLNVHTNKRKRLMVGGMKASVWIGVNFSISCRKMSSDRKFTDECTEFMT